MLRRRGTERAGRTEDRHRASSPWVSRLMKILHLEDSTLDFELVRETLLSEGLACDLERVDTRETYAAALDRGGFDLILSDGRLPAFDGLSALALAREKQPEIPFIVVTGFIGEMSAVEAVRNGAADIVLKDALDRLAPSIRRALREVAMRSDGRRLERQLRQSQKMEVLGRLAGGVAHDFNNLLMAITGYVELLLMRLPADHPLRRETEEIRRAAERGGALTRQLLAIGRGQALKQEVLSLNDLVAGMDGLLHRLVRGNIELVTRLDPAAGRVRADREQIEQVIMNLVVNARDAMPDGGHLTISTANAVLDASTETLDGPARPGEYVMLGVSDTGCGMDAVTQSHLFEPYFTTKPPGKGTGLGLSMVYGIVKQSGGHLSVSSEPGGGTSIKVYLPQVTEVVSATAGSRGASGTGARKKGTETILVVEDEEAVRALVREVLLMEGYTVLEAGDGLQAVAIVEKHPGTIHLLLSDTVMPHFGGRELASRVRALRPDIRVLLMSGYTDEAVMRRGVLEPGTAFLQKPFPPDALARMVREVLDGPLFPSRLRPGAVDSTHAPPPDSRGRRPRPEPETSAGDPGPAGV